MIEKTIRCAKLVAKSCVLPVLLCVSNAHALGLGDIKVSSYLGEPLKAQVPVIELPSDDTQEVKVRLASMDEYERHNLRYPSGVSFKFELVKNGGRQPYVKISSLGAVDEPFLDLLVEFSSSAGKITRGYTFLVDPAPGLLQSEAASPVEQSMAVVAAPAELSSSGRFVFNQGEAKYTESPKAEQRKAKKKSKVRPETVAVVTDGSSAGGAVAEKSPAKSKSRGKGGVKRFGKMSMSLSTSLSISKSDPGRLATGDALQEELIAKEKQLKELTAGQPAKVASAPVKPMAAPASTAPIAGKTPAATAPTPVVTPVVPEVPVVVPEPMGGESSAAAGTDPVVVTPLDATSDVAAAVSSVENTVLPEPVEPVAVMPAPPVEEGDSLPKMLGQYWQVGVAGLVLLLVGGIGFAFYRKRANAGAKTKGSAWNQAGNQAGAKTAAKPQSAASTKTVAPVKEKTNKEKAAAPSLSERAKSLFARGDNKSKPVDKNKVSAPLDVVSEPVVVAPRVAEAVIPPLDSAPVVAAPVAEVKTEPEIAAIAAVESDYQMPVHDNIAEPKVKPVIEEMEWDMTPAVSKPVVKPAPVVESKPAVKTVQPASANAPALKVAEKPKPSLDVAAGSSPEYDLLEEADIYLRFGHTKLAEEVLREAIKMNGHNPQSYLTLLGVLEGKADAREFAEFAQQLKKLGDAPSWQKAVEMGRKIDPTNPLYA